MIENLIMFPCDWGRSHIKNVPRKSRKNSNKTANKSQVGQSVCGLFCCSSVRICWEKLLRSWGRALLLLSVLVVLVASLGHALGRALGRAMAAQSTAGRPRLPHWEPSIPRGGRQWGAGGGWSAGPEIIAESAWATPAATACTDFFMKNSVQKKVQRASTCINYSGIVLCHPHGIASTVSQWAQPRWLHPSKLENCNLRICPKCGTGLFPFTRSKHIQITIPMQTYHLQLVLGHTVLSLPGVSLRGRSRCKRDRTRSPGPKLSTVAVIPALPQIFKSQPLTFTSCFSCSKVVWTLCWSWSWCEPGTCSIDCR